MHQDNNPKLSSKSTKQWLKKKQIKVLQWSSQSLDLRLIEMFGWDLKRAVQKQKNYKSDEVMQHYKDEWAKIPPQTHDGVIREAFGFSYSAFPFWNFVKTQSFSLCPDT